MTTAQDLAEQIKKYTLNLTDDARLEDQRAHAILLEACGILRARLETPLDAAFRLAFANHEPTAVRIAMGVGVFNLFAVTKDKTLSINKLCRETGADSVLLVRIMRLLVATQMFAEVRPNEYRALPKAKAFVDGSPLADALIHFHEVHGPVFLELPNYLDNNKFQNPSNAFSGPFQYAHKTTLHRFEWLEQYPNHLKTFNSYMSAQRRGQGQDWFQYYPVEERFQGHCEDPNATLLVDIGGGTGTDLHVFKSVHSHIRGKLVLQDLPETIKDAHDLHPDIVPVAHDFFKAQPIKGARAYYLRSILHNWPDKDAKVILQSLLPAMTTHSLLLINEYVIPDQNAPLLSSQLDMTMMAMYSSLERTREQWNALLESAGFEILKIWTAQSGNPGDPSLIEARGKTVLQY